MEDVQIALEKPTYCLRQKADLMNTDDTWKARLHSAIEASGKSMRAISLASGNSAGYVHSMLNENKDPTISKLMAVCKAIPTSISYILHGLDVTPEDEELLLALQKHPRKRAAIRSLIDDREPSDDEPDRD